MKPFLDQSTLEKVTCVDRLVQFIEPSQIHMKSLKEVGKVFDSLFDDETSAWLVAEMEVCCAVMRRDVV